MEEPRQNIGI